MILDTEILIEYKVHKYTELSHQRQLGIAMKGLMGVNCLSGKSAFNGMLNWVHIYMQFILRHLIHLWSIECL